jgi:uncharacterized protein (DUF736 family)
MSNYQPKDMTGSLFKNDRKETANHPDYKGSALINGVDHWLDAWINEDRNGNKYMSLKLKPKDNTHRVADAGHSLRPTITPIDATDSAPF